MSASRMPTDAPSRARAAARLAVTVDLPTPPLPDPTATMLRTLDRLGGTAGRDAGPLRASAMKDSAGMEISLEVDCHTGESRCPGCQTGPWKKSTPWTPASAGVTVKI